MNIHRRNRTGSRFAQATIALSIGLAVVVAPASAQNLPDSKGTEFWLAFGENLTPVELTLFITSDVNTSGTIEIPGLSHSDSFTVAAGDITSVSLPGGAMLTSADGVEDKGIHVLANHEVTIYALNRRTSTTDAYLALPVDILGTEYIAVSYQEGSGTQLAVAATEDGTTVTITPAATIGARTAGTPFDISLDQGEVYVLRGSGAVDLTGTLITSDAPVAVTSGNKCGNVPTTAFACDHLEEMIPPTSAWGRNFNTMPLKTRLNGDTFRFVASENDTVVTVNGTVEATLARGEFHEEIYADPLVVSATKPILCMQYSNGTSYDNVISDPFMMIVFPYEQFQTGYTISTPSSGFTGNYVNVVAPKSAVGSLQLDGEIVPDNSFTDIGTSSFVGAQLDIDLGTHTLSASQPFGVFVYGFGSADSYGYPGGGSLSPINSITSLAFTGTTLAGTVGSPVSLPFKTTDSNGQPVAGARIDFTRTGSNPGASSLVTNESGIATLTYTGTTAGADTVTAAINALSEQVTVTWSAGDAVSTLTFIGTTKEAAAGSAISLQFKALDANGQPVAGVQVIFTRTGTHPGTSSALTDESGIATLTYTGTKAGTDKVTVQADGATQNISVTWTTVEVTPMLTMEITNQNSNVKVGESTVFEISVSNDGTTPANDLVIKLTIPDNAELISIEQDDPSARVTANYMVDGNVVTVTLGNISAGVAVKVYMNLRVTAAGDLKVTATAAGQNLEAEAEAESKAITVNADEIVRIQRTIGPAPLCGLFGGATLLLTMGMLVTWRTGRRFRPIHNQKKSTLRKGAAMKAKRTMRIGILSAILMIFTGGSTGCIDPSTATFLLGYVLGRTTAPTVLSETCTVNGEVVDCSTLQQ